MSARKRAAPPRLPKKRVPRRHAARARDMAASSFAPILADLVSRVPGAIAAVMVDGEGEAVDYAGGLDPFDLKLAGAHWQIVVADLRRGLARAESPLGAPRALVVRGARRSFVVHVLPDGYAVVLLLSRRAGFTHAARAFSVCEQALAREAGWSLRAHGGWHSVDVVTTRAGRPLRVRDGERELALEILGQLAAPSRAARRERGWRIRLETGAEFTLIREPGGRWYADEPLEGLRPRALP